MLHCRPGRPRESSYRSFRLYDDALLEGRAVGGLGDQAQVPVAGARGRNRRLEVAAGETQLGELVLTDVGSAAQNGRGDLGLHRLATLVDVQDQRVVVDPGRDVPVQRFLCGAVLVESLAGDVGILDLKPVLAHGVHLDESERHLIASKGACVAHCPGSNLKLASGAADFVQYREDGITVGLGTDGSSSSNDLDMFAVMRLTANLARLVRNDPAAIASVAVVRAATIEGARALGMADRIGSLEVGKEADVISVSLREPHLVPVRDPFTTIVFSAGRADIRHVFVAGEQVVENRQPTKVDTEEIMVSALEHLGSGPCLNE